jgi:hypothetical protein
VGEREGLTMVLDTNEMKLWMSCRTSEGLNNEGMGGVSRCACVCVSDKRDERVDRIVLLGTGALAHCHT